MATNARARVSAGETSDDILRNVFAHLPGLQDLLRCAATCKRWRRLVTDRDILRRLGFWPETARRPSVLVGIFSQNTVPSGPATLSARKPGRPPQFLSLQAGDAARLTFNSFVSDDSHDALFHLARPLASRRGLLLARVLPRGVYGGNGQKQLHLAVCRPLVDKRSARILPPPPFDLTLFQNVTGCALLTDADHDGGDGDLEMLPAFQVLLVYTAGGFLCASAYSSPTGTWGAPVRCCQASRLTRLGPSAGVVSRGGTAHWLFMDEATKLCTLNINIIACPARVSLTKIPIKLHETVTRWPSPVPCIAGEDGMLSFVSIRDSGMLELWTKQEPDHGGLEEGGGWLCSELTELGSNRIDLVFFAESRRALLVVQGGAFFTVDLKSKEKTLVVCLRDGETRHVKDTCWFTAETCTSSWCSGHGRGGTCGHRPPPVLYEMDWVFSRRMFLDSVN